MPTKYSMASSRWRRIFRTYRNPLFIVVILFLIVNHFYFLQPETQPPQITPSGIYGLKGFKSPLGHVQHEFGPEDKQTAEIRESRRNAVRGAFLHAWNGYRTYALGHDEVRPMTNLSKDPFGGWGATLVDALSTMLVMELQEEYNDARDAVVAIDFTTTINNVEISVFETIIRYLGGFISAYELSGDELMLRKAEELGKVLIPAFNTHSGLPWSHWNITAQRHNISHSGYYARPPGAPRGHSGISNSAEISTLQLEFIRLSEHTGDPFYGEKARNITDMLYAMGYNEGVNIPGLYPTAIDLQDGIFIGGIASFGGTGDSMFEYFLKEHILVEGAVPQYAQMYIEAVEGMKDYMLFQETQNGKDYIFIAQVDTRGKTPINQMDHLSCFVPGMLALGARVLNRSEDLEIAKGIAETCVLLYTSTETGLAPESWSFPARIPYVARNWVTRSSTPTPGKLVKRAPPEKEGEPETEAQESEEEEEEEEEEEKEVVGGGKGEEGEAEVENETQNTVISGVSSSQNRNRYRHRLGGPRIHNPWGATEWPDSTTVRIETPLFNVLNTGYLLRPETVESLYILYRITGDTKWQEYGWTIFQAIERNCKTKVAYTALRDVTNVQTMEEAEGESGTYSNFSDSMESFFLAETLKYLYLLFSPPDVISLDKFVFNTEAHPFMRRPYVGPVKSKKPVADAESVKSQSH